MKPNSPPFLVGLTTVVVAALAMVATLPGRTFGLGLVTEQLMRDIGINEVTFANINLWATIVGSLFCFPAGRLLDRYGSRIVLAVTLVALGGVVVALGQTEGVPMLIVWIMLTRGFGQSALSVVSITLIGKSFDRRLTWPMATYSVLMSIGFIIAFQTVGHFVQQPDVGWREAWSGIGWALIAAAPITWFALRGASFGVPSAQATAAEEASDAAGFSLREAIATPAFWVFAGATSLFGLASSGLVLFNYGVLKERGLTYDDFLTLQMVSTPFGLLGQGACGWLAKRWSYQRLIAVAMCLYAVALVGMTQIGDRTQMIACGTVMGLSGGMITVTFFAVWSRTFGRRQLGRIQGAAQMLTVLASAVGPLVFAASRDRFSSYSPALYVLASCVIAFAAASWLTPTPVRATASVPDGDAVAAI
jgi:MFS family permease